MKEALGVRTMTGLERFYSTKLRLCMFFLHNLPENKEKLRYFE